MIGNTRRLALYVVLGLTTLMILFPPFDVGPKGMNVSAVEYGFLFTGPASVRNAAAAATGLMGAQGTSMARDMFSVSFDLVRLLIQLVVVWGLYIAVLRTVLRQPVTAPVE